MDNALALEDAQTAYQAYGDSAEWRNFRGEPMPSWPVLPPATRQHWVAAAAATRARVTRQAEVAERASGTQGVHAVQVRVTHVEGPFTTVEPVSGRPFVGEGDLEAGRAAFLAVRLGGGEIGVLRVPPFGCQVGDVTDATLVTFD